MTTYEQIGIEVRAQEIETAFLESCLKKSGIIGLLEAIGNIVILFFLMPSLLIPFLIPILQKCS